MKPVVIYISGAPGSGKTTLAQKISTELNIHRISSDLVHGGVALRQPDHDRGNTIRQIFAPYLIETAKLGISFVVDHVLHKDVARETIIDKLRPHADIINIHLATTDPIARYKQRVTEGTSGDAHTRREELLARADFHAGNLDNTAHPIALEVPQLIVNADDGYSPSFEDIITFIKDHQ